MDITQLLADPERLGLVGFLVLTIWGAFKQWWVPGWLYRNIMKERDEWKSLALSGTSLAEEAANLVKSRSNHS